MRNMKVDHNYYYTTSSKQQTSTPDKRSSPVSANSSRAKWNQGHGPPPPNLDRSWPINYWNRMTLTNAESSPAYTYNIIALYIIRESVGLATVNLRASSLQFSLPNIVRANTRLGAPRPPPPSKLAGIELLLSWGVLFLFLFFLYHISPFLGRNRYINRLEYAQISETVIPNIPTRSRRSQHYTFLSWELVPFRESHPRRAY